MKKIPTVFERDWNGDRSRVVDQVNPGCEWVLAGEGEATRKMDGTCCMVRSNRLFKRRELPKNTTAPDGFEVADYDTETGKTVGWVAVGEGPEDRYHREAWTGCDTWPDGTYELVGPKVQGNPEGWHHHLLLRHGAKGGPMSAIPDVPRSFDGLREWLAGKDIEGIVFHHNDGRMAKIKLRDFGLKRGASTVRQGDRA